MRLSLFNIDHDTDMAYAFDGNVKVHSEWSSRKYKPKLCPKAIVLLDENHDTLGFGQDAKHTLSSSAMNSEQKR